MKYLALIPLVLAASCASRSQVVLRPAMPPAVEPIEAVRYGEVVNAYHVGRYVDPNHPETMHEQHPVYRVEETSRWNLHPISGPATVRLNPPSDSAYMPAPANDAIIAELNHQREVTARVTQEAARLTQSYGELQSVLGEMIKVARNNALLNARLTTNEQRVAGFSRELQKLSAAPQSATNDVPAFSAGPPGPANPEPTLP